jgi:serine/threonine-protein kinase
VSPDGSRIAVEVNQGATSHILVYDWQRGTRVRLAGGSGVNTSPRWSPDGQYIVFQSAGRLFSMRADGGSPAQPLTARQNGLQFPGAFTPDGKRLAFFEVTTGRGSLIQTAGLEVNADRLQLGEPVVYRQTSSNNPNPEFSPDGRWLAYMSTDSGGYDIYVRAFPDTGKQWPVTTGGGSHPVWSRSANELFYRADDQRVMVVPYTATGDTFAAGRPRVWSDRRIQSLGLTATFDLAPDGQRVAAVLSAAALEPAQKHATVVLNFFDEVRRRVTTSTR